MSLRLWLGTVQRHGLPHDHLHRHLIFACPHRGRLLRTLGCLPCQGGPVAVHWCRLHQVAEAIWIDADAIVLRDVQPIWERLNRHDFVAYRIGRPRPQLCSGLLESRSGGVIAAEYQRQKRKSLVTSRKLGRLELGPRILMQAVRNTRRPIYAIPTKRVHPIHWQRSRELRVERDDRDHAAVLAHAMHADAHCAMLTHRALGPLRQASRREILTSRTLAGHLFRRALGQIRPASQARVRWVAIREMSGAVLKLASQVPPDVSAIAGMSRSGMWPASLLAMRFHLLLYEIHESTGLRQLGHGWRMNGSARPDNGTLLIVDDTVAS